MNRRTAVKKFRVRSKTLSAAIRVFPPQTYVLDFYEQAYAKNPNGHAFLYTPEPVWLRAPPSGAAGIGFKVKPITRSSIDTDVPVFSQELWKIKQASLLDCIEMIGTHLRAPRLFSHPERDVAPPCSFEVVAKFLQEIEAESRLRMFAVHTSHIQFYTRGSTVISSAMIDAFMEFNQRAFGSYPTKRLQKRHRSNYKELGLVELGYVGTEEDA